MEAPSQVMYPRAAHCREELLLLGILRESQQVLAKVLNSLGGKPFPSLATSYLFWASVAINRASDGYIVLREIGQVAASKLLIRPALEAAFSGTAVMLNPGFLFRKAFTEWKDDNILLAKDASGKVAAAHALEELKQAFLNENPTYPVECKKVTVAETAQMAGMSALYEAHYRIYCKFTHGAFDAVALNGHWEHVTLSYDTRTMTMCVLKILEVMKQYTGAAVPDLAEFWARIPVS